MRAALLLLLACSGGEGGGRDADCFPICDALPEVQAAGLSAWWFQDTGADRAWCVCRLQDGTTVSVAVEVHDGRGRGPETDG